MYVAASLRVASSVIMTPQERQERQALNQNLRVQEELRSWGLTSTPAAKPGCTLWAKRGSNRTSCKSCKQSFGLLMPGGGTL